MPRPQQSPSPWTDPVFHLQATNGLSGGMGALPWWVNMGGAGSAGTPSSPAPPTYTTTPESHRSPGYMGQAGADGMGSVGGTPYGGHGAGYELNANQAGNVAQAVGGLFGVPGLEEAVNFYAQRTGANNPFGPASGGSYTPGVTVTDNDTNPEPQYRYQGYGSDRYGGGFGDTYYGPARGDSEGAYGEAAMNDFGQSQADWWTQRQPGQGVGGTGAGLGMGGFGTGWQGGTTGAGGGADLIHSGTANPWDWGGGYSF